MTTSKATYSGSSSRLGNLQAVLNKLREVELFSRLNDEEMRAVAGLFEQATAPAGHLIVWPDGTDTNLYIIRNGRVLVRMPNNAVDLDTAILRMGSAFNSTAFLTGQTGAHAFQAMEPVTLWRVSREKFLALLQTHPTLSQSINTPTPIVTAPMTAAPMPTVPEPMPVPIPVVEAQPTVMSDHKRLPAEEELPPEFYERLRARGPFKGFDTVIIQDILREHTVLEPKPGELFVERGGSDTSLYVVVQGRLVIREATDKYVDKRKQIVAVGETANDVSFMTGRQNYETYEALQNLRMWVVKREFWLAYLAAHPELTLQPEPEIRKILDDQAQHKWLQEGEVMITFQRKHRWTIVESSLLYWGLIVVLIVGNIASRQIDVGGQSIYDLVASFRPSNIPVAWVAWITMMVFALLMSAWRVYDWADDFYAVTDRRVVHRERNLFGSTSFNEAPIEKIQNVTVNRRTVAAAVLNMGEVEMDQVGSSAKVIFAYITSPEVVAKSITTQQHRRAITEKASDREKRREQIRRQMELKDRPGDLPPAPRAKMNIRGKPWDVFIDRVFGLSMRQWLGTWLPVQRIVVGDDIVYRKHPFDLLVNIVAPLSGVLVYTLVSLYALLAAPTLKGFLFSWPVVAPVVAIGVFLIIWLFYMYEDWRNDFFVLGKDKVIDIDRKPFGFSSQRREAGFDKIQGITAKTTGTLDQLLGIGNVIIATGASGSELVWERVSNPEVIQQEITARMEALKRKREEDKVIEEYRRWAEWLGIYDELARVHDREQLNK